MFSLHKHSEVLLTFSMIFVASLSYGCGCMLAHSMTLTSWLNSEQLYRVCWCRVPGCDV